MGFLGRRIYSREYCLSSTTECYKSLSSDGDVIAVWFRSGEWRLGNWNQQLSIASDALFNGNNNHWKDRILLLIEHSITRVRPEGVAEEAQRRGASQKSSDSQPNSITNTYYLDYYLDTYYLNYYLNFYQDYYLE